MSETIEQVEVVAPRLHVRAWPDPVIDALGFEPASGYVELCWLPILGPSAVWAMRRLTSGLRANVDGYVMGLSDLGAALGLGTGTGKSSPIVRTLHRLVHFEMARYEGPTTLAVRTKMPPLAQRHVLRLVPALRRAHEQMTAADRGSDGPTAA